MSDPTPVTQPHQPRVVSGKVFVPIFVTVLAVGIAVAVVGMLRMQPIIRTAREKTFPLDAKFDITCAAGGSSDDLHAVGRCPANGKLSVHLSKAGTGVKDIGWALIGEVAGEAVQTGHFAPTDTATIDLAGHKPGKQNLAFVVTDGPVDMAEMHKALGLARPGDVPDTLVRLYQFATVLHQRQTEARVETLYFRVEEAKPAL